MFNLLRQHLKDNSGSESMSRMIIIGICFVIGAIMIGIIIAAINSHYEEGANGIIRDIMN